MITGNIVMNGWRYRRKSIIEDPRRYGIVISYQPFQELMLVEKLSCKKGLWSVDIQQEITDTVEVLWFSGKVELAPVLNLIEAKNE